MPAYSWINDPFGYMGSNSPNFIAAGSPEIHRSALEAEAQRIASGGNPSYNPISMQGNIPVPVAETLSGSLTGIDLARALSAGATPNQPSYYAATDTSRNPTLNWNFLNQYETGAPNAFFRLPTYEDQYGVTYPIRAGTTSLPAGARNATPNWQQLIGGGAAAWGNPGAPTFQAGQNIFQAPTAQTPTTSTGFASTRRVSGAPTTAPSGRMGGGVFNAPVPSTRAFTTGRMGGLDTSGFAPANSSVLGGEQQMNLMGGSAEPATAAGEVYEPEYWDLFNLNRFYETGIPIQQIPPIETETTPEQLASDKLTDEIMRRANNRIGNLQRSGDVSNEVRDRIFQEEAEYIVRSQAAANAPQRIMDLSPSGSAAPSAGQIPWVIPISGISPTQAILATILLNQIAGRSGGGGGYGGGTAASASGSTTNTGTTSTGGDDATGAGAVIGTQTGTPTRTGTPVAGTTPTGSQQSEEPGAGVVPTTETPEQRAAREQRENEEREKQARQLIFGTMGTPRTETGTEPQEGESCPNGWIKNAAGECAPVPYTGVVPVGGDPTRGTVYNQPWGGDEVRGRTSIYVAPTNTSTSTSTSTTTSTTSTSVITTSTPSNPVSQNTTASLRNLLGEGSTTADALSKILPDIYRLYGQGAGSLAQSDLERLAGITSGNIFGAQNRNLTQLAAEQTAAANRALREGNLQDAQDLARQAETLKRQVNPELYDAMRQQQEVATGQVTSDLARLQAAQARQLSPEDVRNAQQAAREAYSARGLVMGPGAIGAEILNRENLARQREQEARTNLQTSLGNLNQTVGFRTANIFDPLAATLSQQYGMQTGNQGLNQALFNQAAGISSGGYGYNYAQNLVNPFTPYTQDLYGTNVNALNAASIANANRAAALEAAKLGQSGTYAQALGSFLGSPTGNTIIRDALKALGIG